MNRQPQRIWKRFGHYWLAGALLLAAATGATAQAQAPPQYLPTVTPRPSVPVLHKEKQEAAPEPIPAPTNGVPVLASGPVVESAGGGCASCGLGCGPGRCVPGRLRDCCGCNHDSICGRFFCGLYEELCCPDPCYEGKWIGAANAAFFVEGTRPVTTTRIRHNLENNYTFPDRSEFFWARTGGGVGKGPPLKETSLSANELSLYQEVAAKGFSAFIETPYLSIDPQVNGTAAGFGDLKVGTKSMLFDRDLFQLGFMFKTYIPIGSFRKGLGTGHVSLEPSLLATLKITPDTYFQTQLSEWIPIAGDQVFAGAILHYHFSLNHVLFRPLPDVELIGTAEFSGYSFQDGSFSDPVLVPPQTSSGTTYLTIGPGLRLVVCEWLDVGIGTAFALDQHGPEQTYRTELRIRY